MNVQPQPILGELNSTLLEKFFNDIRERISDYPNQGTNDRQYLISSPGGDIGSMLAMYDYIRKTEGDTVGTGLLQSAAAVLLQAGKVRFMTRNSLLLFHEPQKDEKGNIPDQAWTLHSHMAGLLSDRTGMSMPEAYDLFDGKFINPERAMNLNLIDKIIELPVIPVYRDGYFQNEGEDNGTSN